MYIYEAFLGSLWVHTHCTVLYSILNGSSYSSRKEVNMEMFFWDVLREPRTKVVMLLTIPGDRFGGRWDGTSDSGMYKGNLLPTHSCWYFWTEDCAQVSEWPETQTDCYGDGDLSNARKVRMLQKSKCRQTLTSMNHWRFGIEFSW